ncbi:ninein isoform 1 [Camelus ferus]|nr:ninein isoform 1 [Camelus ferus]
MCSRCGHRAGALLAGAGSWRDLWFRWEVSAVGYGMDEAEQDQHEARLKELFDSFDTTGTGSLGQEELTDLCHMLSLEEVAPVLQETLLQDNLLGRVHFDQFKEALILILSRTLSNEEHFQEPDCTLEAQPKYVRGGKRYGRRSLPEFQESVEEFAEVTVIEPLDEEARLSRVPASDRSEHWKAPRSEEYEAEGQLRFWNPDDLNASQSGSSPPQDWIEEKLQEVCEDLGITRDGHLNRKKLVSICEQYGLQNVDGESFDESGRRTTAPSAMTSSIGFRVFSCLDDGMGYASVERILDIWQEEGIENSQEILKALDFSLDGNVNLTELTLALENELLVTKNSIHQAALASFKAEIRHLLERVDQVVREKEKLRSDLDKAEKLKSLMASEVDDHHAAIERRNEYNLRKLDEEYKERIAALKNELRKEREQILQQVGKQRVELEQEIEKAKTEENYIRDRLALSLKENSRLENELLENAEKLAEYETLTNKLQRNLENVLAEKFGDLDPSSAEFFLQEERLTQMRNEYEQQCRVLQDQVDELQSELEEYRTQGKVFRLPLKNSLSEELDINSSCIEPDQDASCVTERACCRVNRSYVFSRLGSEECNPLNMSLEAELAIEQIKEQHHRDLCRLRLELEDEVHHYEKQLDETKVACEKERENMKQKYENEVRTLEKQISDLKNEIAELQGQAVVLKEAQHTAACTLEEEKKQLQMKWDEEKAHLQEELRLEHEMELKARLARVEESFNGEREKFIQSGAWTEEKVRGLTQELEQFHQEQLKSLVEKHTLEKEELQKELLEKHQRELREGREKLETECNRRTSQIEAQFQADCQKVTESCENALRSLEGHYRQELKELLEQQREERSQWEFEKDELTQECAEAQERLKDTLQREKEASLVLTQEREMLEKTYKEHLNSMVVEREQLLRDLEDLRNVSESQQSLLSNQILELKSSHERELKVREQVLCQAGASEQLVSQRLERLEMERDQERQEMMSKLLAMESVHKATCEKADRERAEMSTEISRLQNKIKEMQQVASPPSRLQNGCQAMGGVEAAGSGALSLLQQGEQLLEENGDVLLSLQRAHERAVKENVKMATEISRLQQRLQKLEPESVMASCVDEPTTGFLGNSVEQTEPFLLQNRMKQVESGTMQSVLSDLQGDEVRDLESTGTSSGQKQEVRIEESEASIESFSELENSEETRTETWDLKNQIGQLQEQLMILRADCERASEKKQDLLFDVSVLKKKLKVLERIPEASPKYKLLYEDASRENESLQEELRVMETRYDEALENNQELTSEMFRLQDELKKVEEVTETFLSLEKSYNEVKRENEELHILISELKTKNQQLDLENTELSQQNSQNQKELQELNQRLAEMLCQKDEEPGQSTCEEWEQEKSNLKDELEHCKVQSSTLVSSLEAELSEVKIQTHIVEQENLLLKDELEKIKQLHRCPDLSDFQQKISSVLSYNEKLLEEKEALSEELNSCVDKVQNLEDTLQNVNLQMSQIKSDLRVTQQEKEALKQEVMSLRKQLQNAGDKIWAPEIATYPSGFHNQQQMLSWDKLDHLMNEEQQLLWQENERLQTVVQNTKAELIHSREKVHQLESNLLPPKHQKHLNSSGTVKPTEQEKLSLKRECEQFQKERSPTTRKVSQMNSLEREFETIHLENEGLKKKQVKLDEQLMEMQRLRSTAMLSPSPHARDLPLLQQQVCPMVPREQFLQLQHQLLQAERINQCLQEELENRTSETNTPQENQEHLVTVMEERMMEVEQKLKLVKRLLQEKVNQLKEQLCKNTKADAMVKDLYVENAQLLKALEMTEQRQKTAEKRNYLLEEKIASLSNIVRNLTPAPLTSTPPLRS